MRWLVFLLMVPLLYGGGLEWLQGQKLNVRHGDGKSYVVTRYAPKECRNIAILPEEIWKREDVDPACVQPLVTTVGTVSMMHVADGVETFGELETMQFLKSSLSSRDKLIIDTRSAEWFEYETIPGAVNIWYKVLIKYNVFSEEFKAFLEKVNATEVGTGKFDFSKSPELVMFCNGPWCTQSPNAIKALLRLGYPAEKLKWYRGGMHDWKSLAMTTTRVQP